MLNERRADCVERLIRHYAQRDLCGDGRWYDRRVLLSRVASSCVKREVQDGTRTSRAGSANAVNRGGKRIQSSAQYICCSLSAFGDGFTERPFDAFRTFMNSL